MKCLESLIVAFSMYSKNTNATDHMDKRKYENTLCYFPLIGAVIGALCGSGTGCAGSQDLA